MIIHLPFFDFLLIQPRSMVFIDRKIYKAVKILNQSKKNIWEFTYTDWTVEWQRISTTCL